MLKRAAALLLVCASVAVWVSCTSTTSRYLYAAVPTSNEIVVYRLDPASGGLVQLVGSPVVAGPAVQSLAMHPSGKFLFAANAAQNNVSVFTITKGALQETATRTAAGTSPTLAVIDSAGSFLYVANSGSFDISVFSIDPTQGTLKSVTQLSGATAPIGLSALNMAISPGNVLYVTGQGTQGYIEAFPLTNGVLGTPLAGSPYTTGDNPYGLAIAPGGGFLYTGNKTTPGSISEFTIGTGGVLTQFPNSPIGEVYNSPVSLAIDKTGSFLYAANQGNGNLIGYSIGQSGSSAGALNLISTSPFVTGSQPSFVTNDPSGNYIFVGNGSSPPSLQSFSLDTSSGTLTSVVSQNLTGSGSPSSIVVTP